jgi:hypothetical protein
MSTITELRTIARERGIEGYGKMNKSQLTRYIQIVCRGDEVHNLTTNRCVKRRGKVGRSIAGPMPCRDDQLLNYTTNRCISKTGRTKRSKDLASSPRHMINPATGRYVLKTGAVGRQLRGLPPLKKKRKVAPKRPGYAAPARPF